jgi:hypothetical protein
MSNDVPAWKIYLEHFELIILETSSMAGTGWQHFYLTMLSVLYCGYKYEQTW